MEKNEEMTELVMNNAGLEQLLPEFFAKYISLKVIDFSYNRLQSISRNVFDAFSPKARQVKIVKLGGNKFKTPPIEFLRSCTYLEQLELQTNDLEDISMNTFSTFKRLEVLNLSCNQLSKMQGFETNDHLKLVDLSWNSISLIEGLEKLFRLEELFLSNNCISSLSTFCKFKLQALQYLNLSHNKLKSLSGLTQDCVPYLQTLNVAYNEIESLETFPTLISVTELYISNNKLTSLHLLPKFFPSVDILDVRYNSIATFSNFQLPQLLVVKVIGNLSGLTKEQLLLFPNLKVVDDVEVKRVKQINAMTKKEETMIIEEEIEEEEEESSTRPTSAFLTLDTVFDELNRSFTAKEEEDRLIQSKIEKVKHNLNDILEITLHPDDHIFTPRTELNTMSETTSEMWDELNSAPDSPKSIDYSTRTISPPKVEYRTPEVLVAEVPPRPFSTNAKRSKKFWDITSARAGHEKRAQSAVSFHQRKFIAAKDLALQLDKIQLQEEIYEESVEAALPSAVDDVAVEKKNEQIIHEFNTMNNYKQAEKLPSPMGASSVKSVRVVFPNRDQQSLAKKALLKRRNSTFD